MAKVQLFSGIEILQREAWFRSPKRVLTITVEDGYVKAYAYGLDEDGRRSEYGFGLQGRFRPQLLEGIAGLVADFVWGRAPSKPKSSNAQSEESSE